MKCPNCRNQPVSLVKYVVHPDLRKTTCGHCGVSLRRSRKSYYAWYGATLGAIVIGLALAFMAVYLQERSGWGALPALMLALGLLLVVGIPVELLLFKYEHYRIDEETPG